MARHNALSDARGSHFMTVGALTTKQYPSNGQGGLTTTPELSQCADASRTKPAVIDAIQVTTTGSAVTVDIRTAADAVLHSVTFVTGKTETTRREFGAHGLRIDQNFQVIGTGTFTGLTVFYRYD